MNELTAVESKTVETETLHLRDQLPFLQADYTVIRDTTASELAGLDVNITTAKEWEGMSKSMGDMECE
eukprot:12883050-Prorocentrum_lima.AAC.1